mmetsp:Transcript_42306/g.95210  ORF Transcript_42306/g.95210 Transcript_42306/m.95210 type:complete len:389 (+) Transcript_42306:115-1281(+)
MGCSQSSSTATGSKKDGLSERLGRRVGRKRRRPVGEPHAGTQGTDLSFIAEEPHGSDEQRVVFVDVVLLGHGAVAVADLACEEMLLRSRSHSFGPKSNTGSQEWGPEYSPPESPHVRPSKGKPEQPASEDLLSAGVPSERSPIVLPKEAIAHGDPSLDETDCSPSSRVSAASGFSRGSRPSGARETGLSSNSTVKSRPSQNKRSSYLHLKGVTVRTRLWPVERSELDVPTFPSSHNAFVAYVLLCPAWTFDMMECCLWKLCLNKLFTDLHGSRDEQHDPYIRFVPIHDSRSPDTVVDGDAASAFCDKWLEHLGIPLAFQGVTADIGNASSLSEILVRKVAESLVEGQGLLKENPAPLSQQPELKKAGVANNKHRRQVAQIATDTVPEE